jgi:dihydrofolate synthase / folylpolyglutamate synthase
MDIEKAYQEALEYLYQFVDFSLTRGFRYIPGQFDLGRMLELMERLGNPQLSYPIIHVAGTKGKGSVSAMCASALMAGGYQVGLYTSPHLQDYTERIQVNGEPLPHAELVTLVDELKPYIQSIPALTTFEITTALALVYFQKKGVNAGVIEVGLGGRLDATNIVQPLVSVITSISIDHTSVLGNTIEEIAFEKAGIIKPGIPVVLAPQREGAREVIEHIAQERNAALIQVGKDFQFDEIAHSLEHGQELTVWETKRGQVGTILEPANAINRVQLTIPLLGRHQVENAATAYAALKTAERLGLRISEEQIKAGFRNVKWPGRFEVLQWSPLLIIDSAHNRDSALKLRQTLDDYLANRPVVMIFGASEDKDIEGMFIELMPRVDHLIFSRSFHPRAMEPDRLASLAERFGKPMQVVEKVEDAVPLALAEAGRMAGGSGVVLAAGSIFIAAAAREVWIELEKKN